MWTETREGTREGRRHHLPAAQAVALLECTAQGGMEVVGVIHPGDNPGINLLSAAPLYRNNDRFASNPAINASTSPLSL